jgi:5-(carboxyamino)imidazole ribonucleotide mutase
MKVAVILGSDSDMPIAEKAFDVFTALGIEYEAHIYSAHRTPDIAADFSRNARSNGFGVIIAFAGMAAHLAGVLAAYTTLPVIGVPCKGGALDGLDALLSTAQMPSGVPVATVALNGGANAAILAAEILALSDTALAAALDARKTKMRDDVLAKDARL